MLQELFMMAILLFPSSFFIIGPILFIVGHFLSFTKGSKKRWVEVEGFVIQVEKISAFKGYLYKISYTFNDIEYVINLKSLEELIEGNKVKLLVSSKDINKVKFKNKSKIKYTIGVILMMIGLFLSVIALPATMLWLDFALSGLTF